MNNTYRQMAYRWKTRIGVMVCIMALPFLIENCKASKQYTKTEYLLQFQSFDKNIDKQCGRFPEKNLQSLDGTYLALSVDLYKQFLPKLSAEEKKLIQQYCQHYIECRKSSLLSQRVKQTSPIVGIHQSSPLP